MLDGIGPQRSPFPCLDNWLFGPIVNIFENAHILLNSSFEIPLFRALGQEDLPEESNYFWNRKAFN